MLLYFRLYAILSWCFWIALPVTEDLSVTKVFRNSDLWSEVQKDRQIYFPNEEYIIGDKAYPVLRWCISAFRDRGNLTAAQKRFNDILSKVRQVIERAFALLKGRFRRLKHLDMNRTDMIPFVIIVLAQFFTTSASKNLMKT